MLPSTPKTGAFALALVAGLATLLSLPARASSAETTEGIHMSGLYGFTMADIDGKDLSLSSFSGKVLLLVNVASRCGFTPQYEGLEKLYEKYRGRGLVVLGFPANNFLSQEPGTNAEIKTFCTTKFNVTFPMFGKISVKGKDQHPLYTYLTSDKTNPGFSGDIGWNFTKFLADRSGHVVARFDSRAKPDSKEVIQAIEAALGPAQAG
jgi:glutathione peroxidase